MVHPKSMTIGEILRDAREEMGFSEKEAARDLQIPEKFIFSLEKNDWQQLPARVYSRGFFKKYAEYLELPAEELLKEFDVEWTKAFPLEAREQTAATAPWPLRRLLHGFNQQRMVASVFLALLLLIGVYFFYELRFVIRPPALSITSPSSDTETSQDSFPISGGIDKESILTVNGRTIYTNDRGEFSDSVLLSKGLNALDFEAKNRFGEMNKITRFILVK